MKNLPGIDHFLEPAAAFRGTLNRHEQRKQSVPVRRSGVFAQGLAERHMLGFGLRRQPGGVGRHEGEGLLRIAPVFRQIEMHPPDQVPGGIQVLEKGLKIGTGPGQRSRERSAHLIPQRQQGIGLQILRPRHHRRRQDKGGEFRFAGGRHPGQERGGIGL